jgi:hypothetical protein
MKPGSFTFFLMICISIASVTIAEARYFEFEDNTKYWETWKSSDFDKGKNDNFRDTIGNPKMKGGAGNIEDGYLTDLTFNYQGNSNRVAVGDLFIDVAATGYWNYVVSAGDGMIFSFSEGSFSSKKRENDYLYTITDKKYYKKYFNGSNIRNDHPVFLKRDYSMISTGNAEVEGSFKQGTEIKFFDFSDNIFLGSNAFTIGIAPGCANDVIMETVNAAVPEPATILLLCTGLAGVVGVRLRKKRKNNI